MQNNNYYSDCEKEYLKRHFKICRNKKIKKKILLVIFLISFLFFLIFYYLVKIVNPIILSYGEAEINKMIAKSSNNAISEIASTLNYDDFVKVNYDKNGDILTIESNIVKINQVSNALAKTTQDEIDNSASLGINIPIGTCTGIGFLSGKGNTIPLTINPIGNVICNFYTSFEEAGINQTSHKIYVSIDAEISLILPFKFKKIQKSNYYLISESVIIGKIPNVYLNTKNLTDFK